MMLPDALDVPAIKTRHTAHIGTRRIAILTYPCGLCAYGVGPSGKSFGSNFPTKSNPARIPSTSKTRNAALITRLQISADGLTSGSSAHQEKARLFAIARSANNRPALAATKASIGYFLFSTNR